MELSISKLALERARVISPDIARLKDPAARVILRAAVAAARRRVESTDVQGVPQTLVWLGGFSCKDPPVCCADLGVAIVKGPAVVTIVDDGGALQLLARAESRPAPALEPVAGAPGRYRAIGWPGVDGVELLADGRLHLHRSP